MTEHEIIYLVLFGVCLLLSAFFSSSETAFFSIQKVRLKYMVDNHVKGASLVMKMVDQPAKLLSTILLGNNLVNVATAAIATTLAIKYLPEDQGVLIATICTTAILLIFSETVPKTLATQHAEVLSLNYARPLKLISWLLSPIVVILSGIASFFSKLMGGSPIRTVFFSKNEIRTMISAGQQEGEVQESEAKLLQDALDFFERSAHDVMVPRTEVTAIEYGSTLSDFINLFTQYPRSRFPVFDQSMDKVVGILVTKDVFIAQAQGNISENDTIDKLIRPAYFTPESKHIHHLFNEMRETNNQIAIVVDEYGGTAGIVSLSGLSEEIVGEIGDELTPSEDDYEIINENVFSINGKMRIDEVNNKLGLDLPVSADYQTIAGLFLFHLGHIPVVNEQIEVKNIRLVVTEMQRFNIQKVRLIKEDNVQRVD